MNVAAVTPPVNVPVEQLVTVTVPILVPTAPDTVKEPVVLKVRFALPEPGPVTEDNEIGVAAPAAPTVNVALLARVMAPMVIWPVEVPPTTEVPVTETGLFRLMTPVPAAVTLPYNVMPEGWVAVTPPVKVYVPLLPRVKAPVLEKVAALVMAAPPLKTKL